MKTRKSIRELMKEADPVRAFKVESELKGKNDKEIVELFREDFSSIDETIQDLTRIQEGQKSSKPGFTNGVSFYFYNLLDNTKLRKKLVNDLKVFKQIDLLKPLMEQTQKHLNEYEANERVLEKIPAIEGATIAILGAGTCSMPEEVARHVASFFDQEDLPILVKTTNKALKQAVEDQEASEKEFQDRIRDKTQKKPK